MLATVTDRFTESRTLNVINLENALVTTSEGVAWEPRLADITSAQQRMIAGATNAENMVAALEGRASASAVGPRGVRAEQFEAQVADVAEAGGAWASRDATWEVPERWGSGTNQQGDWSWNSASWSGSGSQSSSSAAEQVDTWAEWANQRQAAASAWAGWSSGTKNQ